MKIRLCVIGAMLLVLGMTPALMSAPAGDANKSEDSASSTNDRGVMTDFRRLEEELIKRKRSAEIRKRTLHGNLLRALRNAIARRFYGEREELLKNVTEASLDGNYDNPTSPLVYYVRYQAKDRLLIVRFDFSKDPEFYIQSPAYEKLLVRDSSKTHTKTDTESKKQ